jgi:glycine cleavage system H protein
LDLSAYRFSKTHEWVRQDGARTLIGITDYAQSQLGDVIYVELPAVGGEVADGAKFGVIESVKAASDLYSPVAGKVLEQNALLAQKPEVVNTDPYGEGWMLALETAGTPSPELLDATAYEEYVKGL